MERRTERNVTWSGGEPGEEDGIVSNLGDLLAKIRAAVTEMKFEKDGELVERVLLKRAKSVHVRVQRAPAAILCRLAAEWPHDEMEKYEELVAFFDCM
jgi:hypothetical protein